MLPIKDVFYNSMKHQEPKIYKVYVQGRKVCETISARRARIIQVDALNAKKMCVISEINFNNYYKDKTDV